MKTDRKIRAIFIICLLSLFSSCGKSKLASAEKSDAQNISVPNSKDTISLPYTTTIKNSQDDIKNIPLIKNSPSIVAKPAPQIPASPMVNYQKSNVKNYSINHSDSLIKANKIKIQYGTKILKYPQEINSNDNNAALPPPPAVDSVMPEPLTPAQTTVVEEKPKNAVLGFSYYPQIPQNEERDLRVFVKIQSNDQEITKNLKEAEKEDLQFTKTEDSSVVCIVKNIQAYKKLSIKPVYDTTDFRIIRVDEEVQGLKDVNEQTLDFINGNYWHWKIKAISPSAHVGNITLLIRAETPEGQTFKLAERQIKIKIGIDKPPLTFWEKGYNFFNEHFKEFLSLIIIPLALYLFTVLKNKFTAKKVKDPDENKPENQKP